VTQNAPDKSGKLTGYQVIQNGEAEVPLLLFRQHVRFMVTVPLTPDFTFSKFIALVLAPPIKAEFSGFTLGDQLFYRMLSSMGMSSYGSLTLKQPLSLLAAIRPMLSRQLGLEVGKSYPVEVFDPINSGVHGQAQVKVAAKEVTRHEGKDVEAYRMDTTFGGITRRSWVGADGITIRRELAQGLVLEQGERKAILARYPGLRDSIPVPRFDVGSFVENARKQGPNQGILPPDALRLIGQMAGGE
jgi:hypothetical protein